MTLYDFLSKDSRLDWMKLLYGFASPDNTKFFVTESGAFTIPAHGSSQTAYKQIGDMYYPAGHFIGMTWGRPRRLRKPINGRKVYRYGCNTFVG